MNSQRGLWWHTCDSLEDAERFLEYSRTRPAGNSKVELVGIYSPYINTLGVESWSAGEFTLIGVDVVSIGEWSLLRALSGSSSEEGKTVRDLVNSHGLLPNADAARRVEHLYRQAAERNAIEEIASVQGHLGVEAVGVFAR